MFASDYQIIPCEISFSSYQDPDQERKLCSCNVLFRNMEALLDLPLILLEFNIITDCIKSKYIAKLESPVQILF